MARRFVFKGREIEEVRRMSLDEFVKLLPSNYRRTLKRMSYKFKRFLELMRKTDAKKIIKTHLRDMVVIPEMLDRRFQVYNGKERVDVMITPQTLGKRLGELSITTKMVKHSGPGVGATRGSKSVELK